VKRALALVALAPLLMAQSRPASEPKLVPDISSRSIEIRYSFTGTQLLLFGAILYPGGRVERPAPRPPETRPLAHPRPSGERAGGSSHPASRTERDRR